MSWGINETAPEIEKIKSESADYLNGLNSCGVIDWNTYNYAFDFYADLLMKAYEQGRKDAQLEPCEDAVNRQRLLDDLKKLKTAWKKYPVMAEQIKGVEAAIGYAEAIPSVTPKRKTGKWIEYDSDEDKYDVIKCPCCKHTFTVDAYHWTDIGFVKDDFKFCPNCGADMRQKEETK